MRTLILPVASLSDGQRTGVRAVPNAAIGPHPALLSGVGFFARQDRGSLFGFPRPRWGRGAGSGDRRTIASVCPQCSISAAHYPAPADRCQIDGQHGSVAAMLGFPYNRPYMPREARTGEGGVCAPILGGGGHCCGRRQSLPPAPLAPCAGGSSNRHWAHPVRPRLGPLG
jgi:hypothetical protein